MTNFESNEFAIQIISKGAFVDDGSWNESPYLVEATTIRMNHVALNEWILSEMMNVRECYDTDEEWEAHKTEYAARREAVKTQIIDILGIDVAKGSVCIKQAQSEVFTVVHITKIA